MPEASKFHGLYNPFLVKLKMFDYWIYYGVMNSPAQKSFSCGCCWSKRAIETAPGHNSTCFFAHYCNILWFHVVKPCLSIATPRKTERCSRMGYIYIDGWWWFPHIFQLSNLFIYMFLYVVFAKSLTHKRFQSFGTGGCRGAHPGTPWCGTHACGAGISTGGRRWILCLCNPNGTESSSCPA